LFVYKADSFKVTVQVGLRIYCAGRNKM